MHLSLTPSQTRRLPDTGQSRAAGSGPMDHHLLAQVLAQMSEAVLILDTDLRTTYVNDAFCRHTGIAAEDLIGQPIARLGPPPLPGMPSDASGFEAWIRVRGTVRDEMMMPTADGGAFPAFVTITPVTDDADRIVAYVQTHHDLREMKQAEMRRRESEELFRAISTAAQDAVLLLDDIGRIVFWNDAATRIFGYRAHEAIGQDVHLFLAPDRYQAAAQAAWPRFSEHGGGAVVGTVREVMGLRKDGDEVPLELSVSAMRLGGSWHAVGIMRDISERVEKERELRLFRALLDHSNDAVEVIDIDTLRILDMNEKGCRDLGYSREEILTMSVGDIDPEFSKFDVGMTEAQIARKDAIVLERTHRRKDGTEFPVEISLRFVKMDDHAYALGISRDITRRKLFEEKLSRSNRALRTLSACNITLVHATQEQELLDNMCRTVVDQGGYRLAWIGFMEHDDDKTVRQAASAGRESETVKLPELSWADNECGQSVASRAIRSGTMQIAENLPEQFQNPICRRHAIQYGYSSCMALPLKDDRGEAFGVLNICAVDTHSFDEGEIDLLKELADDLAFGILTLRIREQRNHFQQESLKNLDRYKEALLGTIRSVAFMVEKRDPYTAGHQARVAHLACAIAHEMQLDEDRIEGLRLGAMIHDIGKISVPAEILNRPGKLSDPEFEIIKGHAQAGYDIIKDIDFPWPVADMVLQHHERMNGKGYPQGIAGDAICLEARILAVADVVDSVSAHRPYRPSLGIDTALGIIEEDRGDGLDAEVVDACLRLFREKGYALDDTV
ncbi:PAS domain S-box protein [Oricola sp.]|uniref:PAS domain S-box protein n=1 Tax=Oricola sp. TaxID=1979950 RepID=UPI0025DF8BD4|nr:PAS domain S-box protein [Oricola sp.]MCI5076377.1 PAS domain S-box protein [Oricola sp.]